MSRPRAHTLSKGPRTGSSRPGSAGPGAWWTREPRSPTGPDDRQSLGPPDHAADEARTSRRLELVAGLTGALQQARDEGSVMALLGEALRGLGLNGYVALLGDDRTTLVGRMVAVAAAGAAEIERLLGRALVGARIVLSEAPPYRAAVEGAKVARIDTPIWWARLAAPALGPTEADAVARLAEVGEVVLAPIRTGDGVLGVLTVWAARLDDADVALAEILGRVVGDALVGQAQTTRAGHDG